MSNRVRLPVLTLLMMLVTCGAALLHYSRSERVYEAHARIKIPGGANLPKAPAKSVAESLAAQPHVPPPPAVITAAAEMLKQRSLQLTLASPLNSEADELASRTRIEVDQQAGEDEITLTYATTESAEAVPVLNTVVDAWVASQGTAKPAPPTPAQAVMLEEKAQLDKAFHAQHHTVQELQKQRDGKATDEPTRTVAMEKVRSLGKLMAESCGKRLEAEERYLQAQRDISEGLLPLQLIIARLPEGEAQAAVQEALTHAKLQAEMEQHRVASERIAAFYGKNHPKMKESLQKTEELQKKLAATKLKYANESDASPDNVLLRALESELTAAQALERDVQDQLDQATAFVGQSPNMQKQLDEAQRELTRLQGETATLQQRIDMNSKQNHARSVEVVQTATLFPDPVSPNLKATLGWGALAGVILGCLACWATSPLAKPVAAFSVAEQQADDSEQPLSLEQRRRARTSQLQQNQRRAA